MKHSVTLKGRLFVYARIIRACFMMLLRVRHTFRTHDCRPGDIFSIGYKLIVDINDDGSCRIIHTENL